MKENEILVKILKINKLIMILLISILIVLTLGVSKMYYNDNANQKANSNESEYNTNYDVSMFTEIKAKDIKNKTKNSTEVIYIGRETCSWCTAFLPALWQAQEEFEYTTLYIDLAKIIDFTKEKFTLLDEESYNLLTKLNGDGYENYMKEYFGATPMVLIIKDNKIIGASTGYSEYDAFKTILNDAGIK